MRVNCGHFFYITFNPGMKLTKIIMKRIIVSKTCILILINAPVQEIGKTKYDFYGQFMTNAGYNTQTM